MEESLSEPKKEETVSEEKEGQKESDAGQSSQTTEMPEASSKRLNKRKQRFPTRQTIDLMKALQKVKQGKLCASGKIQTMPQTKSEQPNTPKVVKRSKEEEKSTEVVLRRSSRPVKKKKMFDELDEPEVKSKSKQKKNAKMVKETPLINNKKMFDEFGGAEIKSVRKPKKNAKIAKGTSVTKKMSSESTKKDKIEEEKSNDDSNTDKLKIDESVESKNDESSNTNTSSVDDVRKKVKEEENIVMSDTKDDVSNEKQDQTDEENDRERKNVESEKKDEMETETGENMQVEELMEDKNDKENKDIAHKTPVKSKKKYKCLVCEKAFSSLKALKRHERVVHEECNEEFKCNQCDRILKSKKAYDRHQVLHTDSSYQCNECGEKFFSHVKVKQHFRIAHGEILPFKCNHEGCEKRFASTSNRKKHIEAVHLNLRNHICILCNKAFKNSSALRVHLLSIHADQFQNQPKFMCGVCNKVFRQKLKLRMHETVHTAIRPYKCKYEDCEKTFRLKSNKIKHERVHENYRPYTCNTCGQAFSRRIYLETHQYKHTGVKQYKCLICHKTFSQKGNLNIHMKIHSEDRDFVSCDVCGKSFSNKSNLTKHKQSTCSGTVQIEPLQHKANPRVRVPRDAETMLVHPLGTTDCKEYSFILREVHEAGTSDTVYIVEDDNKPGKTDKACGTDDVKRQQFVQVPVTSLNDRRKIHRPSGAKHTEDFSTYKPNTVVHDEIVTTIDPPSTVKQKEIMVTDVPKQLQSLLSDTKTPPASSTTKFETHAMPQSGSAKQDGSHTVLQSNNSLGHPNYLSPQSHPNSEEVVLTTQPGDFHTYLLEKGTQDMKPTTEEQVSEHVADPTTVFTPYAAPANVANAVNTLADIILPSSVSENVEYEIISSGLDGVEEGILKEFLNKWSQQGSTLGSTVILDVQNPEAGDVASMDGVTVPESVQYIVTVKEQE